jgi:hypothetical protein
MATKWQHLKKFFKTMVSVKLHPYVFKQFKIVSVTCYIKCNKFSLNDFDF